MAEHFFVLAWLMCYTFNGFATINCKREHDMDYDVQLRESLECDDSERWLQHKAGDRYSYPMNGIPAAVRQLTDEEERILNTPCLRFARV